MNIANAKWPFMLVAAVFMIHLLPGEARAEKRIGMLLWSEESRYGDSRNGVVDQLKKGGFREPAVRFTMENAGGNKARAAELARKFAAAKMDLIVAIGTTAAIAVTREIKELPVVFSMVYDPVEAKIAEDWQSSGNNTTGASPKVPMTKLINILKELAPVQRLAVLYTPNEKNSETQLKELQGLQAGLQIKVIPVPLTRQEEAAQILPEVIRAADAIYLSGSSIVGKEVHTIVEMANKAKVPTITHLDDLAEQGVLLGVCADPYLVGRLAGDKAVKVLKGAKPAAIPIEFLKKLDVILNMRTAKAGQFRIPSSFMKSVTKTIE